MREVVNASSGVLTRYGYDAYGRVTKLSGTVDSDFQYTGHYAHSPSGLYLAPYRAYDAELGRWISRDPLDNAEMLQGPNLYAYVANNPISWVDPLGLWGLFGFGGGSVEAGAGSGGGAQASSGYGYFMNNSGDMNSLNTGGFYS